LEIENWKFLVYLVYAILGLLPSAVWLLFYLRKDAHPEPNRLVLLVFLGGALMGPIAALLQFLILRVAAPSGVWPHIMAALNQSNYLFFLNIIILAPLSEELLKYLAVRWTVLKNPEFDEPLDAMVYMIVSALGFAATENLLNIFLAPNQTLSLAASQALARFLSATFLHALASGILGYFIALSLLNFKKKVGIFWQGFILAVIFHSFYNYLAWLLEFNKVFALALAVLLVSMAGLVSWQFRLLKKQGAVCRLN